MRALTLVLAALIVTLAGTKVSAAVQRAPAAENKTYSCRIVSGYGTAIGHGPSKLKAKENAREICGDKLIDQYLAQRGSIPENAIGDLTTACVNLECM